MNLLELMLKEEIEWPVGAEFAAQSVKAEIVFCKYGFVEGVVSLAGTWRSIGGAIVTAIQSTIGRADDFHKRIITSEEYQATGGWMKWAGGKRPVHCGVEVETKWDDGDLICASFDCDSTWAVTDGDSNIISYRIIKQAEPGFEQFVSIEDAQEYKEKNSITPSKYTKEIHGVSVDVYDVLMAWVVTNPALQHLIKKALQCGQRGHKDKQQDLQDIIDSAIRAKELECQKN